MSREKIAILGLGSMGGGMARSALAAGLDVVGYDPGAATSDAFAAAGGTVAASPRTAVDGARCVFAVVVNARQTEDILFGGGDGNETGIADVMLPGSVFVGCSTMPPDQPRRFAEMLGARDVLYLDAPMSGGPAKAAEGALTFMASGTDAAFDAARFALDAMGEKTYRLGDQAGAGATMKMINQLLAGVHIAAACEAMAFAVRMGLNADQVYEVITHAAGNSWMFENRVPHILEGDYSPKSAVGIFTKDLGIVSDTARDASFPLPMANTALQMFTMAAAAGMTGDDDASVARVYAMLSGIALPDGEA
ncbi:MAG: L-threonate dehydrogenase [Pseudomonadota bacterium]